MRILLTIVHYWDPQGDGKHQSLRPDPTPRQQALQQQLLCLRRLGSQQSFLHMADRAVYPANDDLRSEITRALLLMVNTGGLITAVFARFDHVITLTIDKTFAEAQKHLSRTRG